MDNRSKKAIIIGLVILVISASGLVFAALSSSLAINGAGTFIPTDWDVIFVGTVVKTEVGSGRGTLPELTPTKIGTYEVALAKPGDKVIYKFVVKNNGTVDAVLSVIQNEDPFCMNSGMNNDFDDADYMCDVLNQSLTYTENGKKLEVGDILEANEVKNLTLTIEYPISAIRLPKDKVTINFSDLVLIYEENKGSTIVPPTEGMPSLIMSMAEDVSDLEYLYPSSAESRGYTKVNGDESNTFNLTSSGIQYVFNSVAMPSMTGKNIILSLDMYTTGVSNRGSGCIIKLRSPKESDVANAINKDYYAVLYDGTIFRIIKSTSGSLNSVSNEVSISEATLGASYNILVKTFNNLIHAELRNESGKLVSQIDYFSEEFNSHTYVNNGIAYNNNIKIGNVKATNLDNFINVIGFGDSNTYGESLTPNFRIEESWTGQINNLSKENKIVALNKGVTYHTSANLVSRLSGDVYANKVIGARNIAIIYIGTNDFNQVYGNYSSQLANLKNNIETMRSGMEANGFEVWLVTFPVCNDPNGPGQGRNPGLRAYNDWLLNDYFAIQAKVPVVIDYASVQQDPNDIDKLLPQFVASDGLHSSAYGNNWLAKEVMRNLK